LFVRLLCVRRVVCVYVCVCVCVCVCGHLHGLHYVQDEAKGL